MRDAFRSFALLLGVAAVWFGPTARVAADPEPQPVVTAGKKGVVIPFEGPIRELTAQELFRQIDNARQAGAEVIILRINSPGGLASTSFEIADHLNQLDLPVVAYIPQEAISGGAVVALGADRIYMHREARIGDAGVIAFGEDGLFRFAEQKIITDLAVRARRLAEHHGRPPSLAEAMFDMKVEVFKFTNTKTGAIGYFAEKDMRAREDRDDWKQGELVIESEKNRFFEAKGDVAARLGFVEGTVESLDELTKVLELAAVPRVMEATWVDHTIRILNDPWITVLLLIIGVVAIYVEVSTPGLGLGGVLAILCFALFFWSRFLGGTSGWLEVIIFGSGLVCLLIELFVLPGFGVMGIAGLVLMGMALVMASQNFVLPATKQEWDELTQQVVVLASAGLGGIVAISVVARFLPSLPIFSGMVLGPPTDDSPAGPGTESSASATEPFAGLVGQEGVARTVLRPAGKALIGGTQYDVVAEGSYIPAGSRLRVLEATGNRIVVRNLDETPD